VLSLFSEAICCWRRITSFSNSSKRWSAVGCGVAAGCDAVANGVAEVGWVAAGEDG
jgi:hypothetical protein